MAPPLARQLLLAQQELREAEAKLEEAKCRNNRALNKKRYLLRAAKQRRDAAVLRMKRVKGEIKSKQCLFLHNVEQVHAVVELLENLHHRGRLRRVEIRCREVEVAQEMQQALQEYGFKSSVLSDILREPEVIPSHWIVILNNDVHIHFLILSHWIVILNNDVPLYTLSNFLEQY